MTAGHGARHRPADGKSLRVDVLGPLRVRSGGAEIAVPAGKPSVLLACLVTRSGHASADVLCADLWPAEMPDHPRHALENHVSRLRMSLRRGGVGEVLLHSAGGYHLAEVSTDVEEFERLVAAGRRAAEGGDLRTAVSLLSEADGRWRGEPFEDLTTVAPLAVEAARLAELRRGACDIRFDAELRLQRSPDLVAALRSQVAEDPLNERRRGQLMLALYRAGRQAEALEVFQEGARLLSEELGVDPGPDLRRLHLAVLRQEFHLVDATNGGPLAVENEQPPARGAAAPGGGLPRPRTSFVGRQDDVAELAERVRGGSLITLTGVGGCGKTRLAVEAARRAGERFPGGVFFVDLAAISDPAGIVPAVARATGRHGRGGPSATRGSPLHELVAALSRRCALLVLDNCEHLLADCAALVDHLLEELPGIALLATSREPLRVVGEECRHVEPLSVTAEAAGDPDAFVLLVDRVRGVRPDLRSTGRHRRSLLRICERLDGIPLALELAAARMSYLSPADVADRLDDRFRLLAGGARGPARQRTLEAALDWSYDLLDGDEQRVLRRLSVFSAGFDLRSAEAVCAGAAEAPVVDVLGSLVDKSLVAASLSDDRTRFRLLETVRLYAARKLAEAGERHAARDAHRDWYLLWLEEFPWDRRLLDPSVARRIGDQYENLRLALEWSRTEGRLDLVARFACALAGVFAFDLDPSEGQCWFGAVLDADATAVPVQSRAESEIHRGFVENHRFSGDPAWFAELGRRIRDAIAVLPDSHPAVALGWWDLAGFQHALDFDPDTLDRYTDEVIARSQTFGAPLLEAYAHVVKTQARIFEGRLDRAAHHLDVVAALTSAAPEARLEMVALDRAVVQLLRGRHDEARQLLDAIEGRSHRTYWQHLIGVVRAAWLTLEGDVDAAEALIRDVWHDVSDAGWHHPMAPFDCVLGLAVVEAHAGRHERAARLLATLREDGRIRMSLPMLMGLYLHARDVVRGHLDADARRRARRAGEELLPQRVLADALGGAAP